MKRKLGLIALITLAAFVLSACWAGQIHSNLTITSQEGAGSKEIYVEFLKDGEEKPDGSGAVDQASSLVGGIDATVEKLKEACKLDGVTITAAETAATHIIKIAFTFNSIDDYNAKMTALADGAALEKAALSVDGDKVTFTEPTANLLASVMWAVDAVYGDAALYDNLGGSIQKVSPDAEEPSHESGMVTLNSIVVKVGDQSETVDMTRLTPADTITVTGTIAAAQTETPPESPVTGDNLWPLAIAAALLLAAAAAALIVFRTRKKTV